jgi:hypothetical protein
MKWLLTTLLAAAVLSAAAAQPPGAEAVKQTPYLPLQVGNTWTYRLGEQKVVLKVAKYEKVGDVTCARVEMLVEGMPKSYEMVGVTDDGVYRYAFEGKRIEPPLRFLKLPPKKGETWPVDSALGKSDKGGGQTIKGTFKAGEEKVTVPERKDAYDTVTAGSDDLDVAGEKMGLTYYFAQNVGMVKQVMDVAGQKVTLELEKFEKGEPAKK